MNDANSVAARLSEEVRGARLQPDPAQLLAATRLDELREALTRTTRWFGFGRTRTRARGVYLWGGVGRGKTLLMDLFFASLPAGLAERDHFYHFMRNVHAGLAAIKRHERPLDVVAQRVAARTRVICLDEIFVADIADAMILAGLFEGLFRRGVMLVATSNLAPHELYKDGLQRQRFLPAIELIRSHVDVMHLDGGVDYRLRLLAQAPVYLDAAAPGTAVQMAESFATLAGAGTTGPVPLQIESRRVDALDTGPGMAWFTFAALCAGPRSQNDYIELARLYHTIFISDIPPLNSFNDNAARRFITLVDEFYDRGVKLVVSAAAPPTALYHGERLRFEFERAASRLIEMQTQAYLAGEHRP